MDRVNSMKEALQNGLYLDNLSKMISTSMQMAKDSANPLPFYVLASVFADIYEDWEDRALTVEEANRLENKILQHLNDVMDSMIRGDQAFQTHEKLSTLLKAFFS